MRTAMNVCVVRAGLLLGSCGSWVGAWAEDWPAFRGAGGDGIYGDTGAKFPVEWGPDKGVRWKVALPGPGNGSPVVHQGRVYVASAIGEGKSRSLLCFDRRSGKQLWERTVEFDRVLPTHKTNPHGSTTPAASGNRVVVWHASAGLYAYDLEGREVWRLDLGEFRHMWGYGTSPMIHGGRVFLHSGPGKRVVMTAVDLATGKKVWEVEEPFEGDGDRNENNLYMGSWSTPVLVKAGNREVVVCSLPVRVNAYDPATGEIVWTCDGLRGRKGDLAYTSPVIAGNLCVAMGGFGGPAMGFRMEGSGNITEEQQLWRVEPNPQRIGSGVFVEGLIYMANAGPATFQCIDPKTGKVLWEERSPGGAHWASTVYADGRLYSTDQEGTTHVWEAHPERLKILASNPLKEPCNATPAFSDGEIFVRTFRHLWCAGER